MVKAGKGTDDVIDELLPHLSKGDLLIDGGNTFFQDNPSFRKALNNQHQLYWHGWHQFWNKLPPKRPEDGRPTVTYVGPNGAGHYVKMVHNGIDRYSNRKDDLGSDKPIVDVILDRAGNKGTGKWSSQSALEVGAPQSLITESVYARYISALKSDRLTASAEDVRQALYFGKIMSYAQGFDQLRMASDHYDWNLPFGELAQLWRAGAIIRAQFLQRITDAYTTKSDLHNCFGIATLKTLLKSIKVAARRVVALAVSAGVPTPSLSAAVAYYDSYRSAVLPANLIQAQRDYFGAHTYERVDKPAGEMFHYSWYDEA
ncbi:hypothetical protein Pfo_030946 [Paulownia fortunei]|nr:hypothetical protein Pfo_030946 [Paulownia fortunei]